jgi:hypothetical protein
MDVIVSVDKKFWCSLPCMKLKNHHKYETLMFYLFPLSLNITAKKWTC